MHREVLHCTGRVVSHQPTLHWVGYTTPDYSTQGELGALTNPTLGALGGLHHTSLRVCIH